MKNIDEFSYDELKERLIVAEAIMKKLYRQNKELEKNYENSLRKEYRTSLGSSPRQLDALTEEKENFTFAAVDKDKDKEKEEWLEKEKALTEDIETKTKLIFELEERLNAKFQIDSSKYNVFLQERLKETMEEARRYFDNYILTR